MNQNQIEGKKELLIFCCRNAILDLLFYNRKECEDLCVDDIDFLIEGKHITKEEIMGALDKQLSEYFL